jgi:hypothetical protein
MLAERMVRVKARLESEQPSTPDPAPEASP